MMNEKNTIRLHILGSCSGTEPFSGRHHTSVALELDNSLYFLDAGECCSYTAHLKGLDLLKTKAIFVSHCHMDHVGGLGNLLWNIRKLSVVKRQLPEASEINVYIPQLESYEGIWQTLQYTEDHFRCAYGHQGNQITDGLMFEEKADELSVDAVHNHHLPHQEGEPWRSFSFRIACQGNMIFYSGDTQLEDLAVTVPQHCDVLLMETGHHRVKQVCEFLKGTGKHIGKLVFIHHGVEVLQDPEEARREAKAYWGEEAVVTEDGDTIDLSYVLE